MPDANNPSTGGTGEDTSATIVDALADILDDPAPDTVGNEAAKPAVAKPKSAADEVLDDDEETEDATDDETSDAESKAGTRDPETGRFISPKAKVKLPDGTETTVAELTAGHLRQSDYTRKTQEVAEQREAVKAERERAQQIEQQLQAQFQQVNNWLSLTKPQRPNVPFEQDPIAHGQYREAMDQWQEAQQYWAVQQHKATEQKKAETQAAYEKHLKNESEALFKAVPALRDPGKRDAFVTEAAKMMADYGIKREEIAGLTDHRMILILRDAVKYRRLQAKAPQVKDDLGKKPPIIRGSQRAATPTASDDKLNRQRTERLKQTGRLDDGIAALMAMKNL
jgi:hypothetical protein